MSRDPFISEVEVRLRRLFTASQQGYKASPAERHRLEGFMQAGVFMGLSSNKELAELMGAVHLQIFGKSISERRQESPVQWQGDTHDYSQYDQPTFVRR